MRHSDSSKALLQSLLRQGIDAFASCLRRHCELFMQLWGYPEIEFSRKVPPWLNLFLGAYL
jgi:hypothetical protein